jgi:putative nucleotidyltransferase with HDIG domain
MPKGNGLDFLKHVKSINPAIPVVIVTAFPSSQTAITAFREGAFDYITKPFEPSQIVKVAEGALSQRIKLSNQDRLVENLKKAIYNNFFATTEALLLAIDAKDSYTAGHSRRVSRLFGFIAKELGIHASRIEVLRYGAFLHDIGKIGVSDYILTKPGSLLEEEMSAIREHPLMGYNILEPIGFLKNSLSAVLYHHERYDGKGYPEGLKGNEIPYEAAILAVIDMYDALTSDRPYHKQYSHEEALSLIGKEIGSKLVPTVTESVVASIVKYYNIEAVANCSISKSDERSLFDEQQFKI